MMARDVDPSQLQDRKRSVAIIRSCSALSFFRIDFEQFTYGVVRFACHITKRSTCFLSPLELKRVCEAAAVSRDMENDTHVVKDQTSATRNLRSPYILYVLWRTAVPIEKGLLVQMTQNCGCLKEPILFVCPQMSINTDSYRHLMTP